jgi:hypothetical protein
VFGRDGFAALDTRIQGRDYGKSQWIRAADVVFVGPVMVWGGARLGGALGWTLGLLGAGTIALNGYNFVRLGGFAQARAEVSNGNP